MLQPTDKVVWQVVRIGARAGEPIAFPGYRQILRAANIRPVSPVSRALAVLHVACWVTLCARVRDPRGGFRGNVYVLHDEPLGLADTLELDHGHMEFLDGVATDHAHRRVRDVAAAALATIAGRDLAHAARTARAALLSATGYRYLGITRDRVRLGTARALEVRSLMGEVPAELLDDPPAGPPDDPAGGSQRAL